MAGQRLSIKPPALLLGYQNFTGCAGGLGVLGALSGSDSGCWVSWVLVTGGTGCSGGTCWVPQVPWVTFPEDGVCPGCTGWCSQGAQGALHALTVAVAVVMAVLGGSTGFAQPRGTWSHGWSPSQHSHLGAPGAPRGAPGLLILARGPAQLLSWK